MRKIKVVHEKIFWECECCGGGFHTRLTVGEKVYSCNDQFGGTLDDCDVDLGFDPDEEVSRILNDLKSSGIEFEYEECFDSYDPTDWTDYDDD